MYLILTLLRCRNERQYFIIIERKHLSRLLTRLNPILVVSRSTPVNYLYTTKIPIKTHNCALFNTCNSESNYYI